MKHPFAMKRRSTLLIVLAVMLAAALLAACTPPPVSQTPPIRAGLYYPWFPEAWTQQGTFPFTNYLPTRGYYDTDTVVKAQIADMQYANMTAGFASWWGQGSATDSRVPALLSAAAGTGFQWAIYYEPEGVGNPTSTQIAGDLAYIKAHYANDPSYLHVNGKPVIFAFGDATDNCGMADRWAAANSDHAFYVGLKVFSGYKACASQPDAWHQYGPAVATDSQPGYSYTISPGFYKKGETSPRLTRDPARFETDVQQMVASKAPWQLVTTFNEWGEGTSVESGSQWASASGYGAYLDILHKYPTGGTTTTTTVPRTTTTGSSTSTSTSMSSTSTSTSTVATTTSTSSSTTTTVPTSGGPCGSSATPVTHQKVVVFSFENRSWPDEGGTQFQSMPYTHSMAVQCSTFASDTEPDTGQNSATQYVGTAAGSTANTVRNDCSPSTSCQSTQDNIFRQVRTAGLTPRSYVEGATSNCSASGNAAKHIPALYFKGGTDPSFCSTEVVPYSTFNPANLPDFSFVTPTLCNDGHDCSNTTVDNWLKTNLPPILNSADYKAGKVTVDVWWDEDHPKPNMILSATATAGVKSTAIDYGSHLRLWEDDLGLPNIAHAVGAANIRTLAHT